MSKLSRNAVFLCCALLIIGSNICAAEVNPGKWRFNTTSSTWRGSSDSCLDMNPIAPIMAKLRQLNCTIAQEGWHDNVYSISAACNLPVFGYATSEARVTVLSSTHFTTYLRAKSQFLGGIIPEYVEQSDANWAGECTS